MEEQHQHRNWMILALFCGMLYVALISWIVTLHTPARPQSSQTVQNHGNNLAGDGQKAYLTVFDLGVGSASLIQQPNGETVLINTGDPVSADSLLQQLRSRSVDRIDLLILTETDYRHAGGLGRILQAYPVTNVILPTESSPSVKRMLMEQNVAVQSVRTQQDQNLFGMEWILIPDREQPHRLSLCCIDQHNAVWFVDPAFTTDFPLPQSHKQTTEIVVVDHGFAPYDMLQWILHRNARDVVLTSCDGLQTTQQTFDRLLGNGVKTHRTDRQGTVTIPFGENGMT
jgi:beta-lactamase superfamily II metal-dependent hydrolase